MKKLINKYIDVYQLQDKIKEAEVKELEENLIKLVNEWNRYIDYIEEMNRLYTPVKRTEKKLEINSIFLAHALLLGGYDTKAIIKALNKYQDKQTYNDLIEKELLTPKLSFDDAITGFYKEHVNKNKVLNEYMKRFNVTGFKLHNYIVKAYELDGYPQRSTEIEKEIHEEAQKLIDLGLADTVLTISELDF